MTLSRNRPPFYRSRHLQNNSLSPPILDSEIYESMSDIQLYLVEFDKNRKEATAIAAQSAQSIFGLFLSALRRINWAHLSCRVTIEGVEIINFDRVARRIYQS